MRIEFHLEGTDGEEPIMYIDGDHHYCLFKEGDTIHLSQSVPDKKRWNVMDVLETFIVIKTEHWVSKQYPYSGMAVSEVVTTVVWVKPLEKK